MQFPSEVHGPHHHQPLTRLLAAEQVADLLAVPVTWVRQAARDGVIPAIKLGRYWRFDEAMLTAHVARLHGSAGTLDTTTSQVPGHLRQQAPGVAAGGKS